MWENEFQKWCPNFMTIQWLTSPISLFCEDMFGCMRKNESSMRGTFLPPQTWSWNSQRWMCVEIRFKPCVQTFRQSNGERVWDHRFTETELSVCGKHKGFWERKRKRIVSLKTDLICFCLQLRYSQPIIYSIFLFLLFYKHEIYFISYEWINKISFLFFFKPLF